MMILMSIFDFLQEWILHFDEKLQWVVGEYRYLAYLFLFIIVFVETGLVVMPFLPGDSLLFAAGSVAALDGTLDIRILIPLLIFAALLGDNTNYFIGSRIGVRIFDLNWRFLKREYLDRTEAFYAKHGGKTLIMARFIPIIRTFAPFAAGLGTMTYRRFIGFCIAGAVLWVSSLTTLGYIFGSHPWVKAHFESVILGIIFISVLPIFYHSLKAKWSKPKSA